MRASSQAHHPTALPAQHTSTMTAHPLWSLAALRSASTPPPHPSPGLPASLSLPPSTGDLAFHLDKRGRFTMEEARYFAARTLLGLQHLHKNGIVYR